MIRAWESLSGWDYFAVEKVREQTRIRNGKVVKDTIWYGFVQGFEDEWGDFSEAELNSLSSSVWEIPAKNIPFSGRRL